MKLDCECQECLAGLLQDLAEEKGNCFTCKGKGYIVFDFSKEEDILKFVQYIPEGYHWLKYHFDLNELSQIELEKLKEVLVNQYRETKAINLDHFINQIDEELWDTLKQENTKEAIDMFVSMYKGWLKTGEIVSPDEELEVDQEDIDVMKAVFQQFHNLSVEHSTLNKSKETIKS
ncbi:TPA: hypothetical protein ACR3Z0_003860 [Bacillus thuringiensis]|uniref:Uncharacterized protein n=1 Tax=Bacillus thuringiensis TaxID=1428 RepID=A0A9X6KSS3_BACTU|nr:MULTISPECIES: hypothetical protein [Bacillus cereus group]AJA23616.1 hypothetical protein BT4G5_33015 [Bacillus thuringiensis serovar galleriae]EJQ96439.1 hypothetical protein II5_06021 [Bacillus cereus MSX-A1]ETE95436.1 hypothetical protein C623_0222460 [Bacillus thuringiensis serovar aizawai str. Hu4-2]KAB1377920.1 hypothetical protein FPG93_20890 [Bacillus thuringiensis]KXI91548.1 hypothetical protein ACS47_07255 [Bacillus cereus]